MSSLDDMRAALKREETFEELTRPVDHHANDDPRYLLMTKIDCPNCPGFKAVCDHVRTVSGSTIRVQHTRLTWKCDNRPECTFYTTTFFSAEALAKAKAAAISEATIKSMKGVGVTAEKAGSSIRQFGEAIGKAFPPIPKLSLFPMPPLPKPIVFTASSGARVSISVVGMLTIVAGVLCAGFIFGGILTWGR